MISIMDTDQAYIHLVTLWIHEYLPDTMQTPRHIPKMSRKTQTQFWSLPASDWRHIRCPATCLKHCMYLCLYACMQAGRHHYICAFLRQHSILGINDATYWLNLKLKFADTGKLA